MHDAEDALQDALLRAWRGLPRLERRSSLKSWLYRIATNACLDAAARRPRRVLPVDYGPPAAPGDDAGEPVAEPLWVEPYPDGAVGLDDGYAAPEARYEPWSSPSSPRCSTCRRAQRAILVLREVLGFSAREVAESLETTVASVNSALQRARRTVEDRLPTRSQQATLRALGDDRVRDLVESFVDAFEQGDVDAILATVSEDATFAMPPYADWYRGRDAVGESWLMPGGPPPRLRYLPTRANGQLALGTYRRDPDGLRYLAIALDVLTLDDVHISKITAFRTPEVFLLFGLPDELPAPV